MTTLTDIHTDIATMRRCGVTPEYFAKQMHRIPQAPVVDRVQYILEHSRHRTVAHLGCSWPFNPMHQALLGVADEVRGIDIDCPATTDARQQGALKCDLDTREGVAEAVTWSAQCSLIIMAEILEHLGNPGEVLRQFKTLEMPLLLTVPNAFAAVGRRHIQGGIENVHKQHVAYYSYHTLLTLVERYGYAVQEMAWYHCPRGAQPQESEGIIFLVR